jgi:hypothetical protein
MAIPTADPFASFDVPAGAYIQDISPALVEAVYFDLNFLEAIPMGWDQPVDDTVHIWNEDALNQDLVTITASVAGGGTTLALSSGHGLRVPLDGSFLVPRLSGNRELIQVTSGARSDSLTVTRGYNSTPTASLAAGTTLVVLDVMQEGSDIGADYSVVPTVRQNSTHIAGARDLKVTGSQLARRMATTALQDWVGHQLANRAIELKRKWIYILLYSEPGASGVGSDTVLRSLRGIRSWATASGVVNGTAEALSLTNLNSVNKSIVDQGEYVDTLLIGTDLVASLAAIDASSRRLYESDTAVGYTVQEVLLNQGNSVRVVIDPRVNLGEAYLFTKSRIKPMPFQGRGMFTIAATDFADARKRRILSEWTLQVNNPELLGFLHSKT